MNYKEIRKLENWADKEIERYGKEGYIFKRFEELYLLLKQNYGDDEDAYLRAMQHFYDDEGRYIDQIEMETDLQILINTLPLDELYALMDLFGLSYKVLDDFTNPVCWLYDTLTKLGLFNLTFFMRMRQLPPDILDLLLHFTRHPKLNMINTHLRELNLKD